MILLELEGVRHLCTHRKELPCVNQIYDTHLLIVVFMMNFPITLTTLVTLVTLVALVTFGDIGDILVTLVILLN